MQFSKFGKVVSTEFSSCIGKEFEIGDLIEPMMKNYQEICTTIANTKIPAIVVNEKVVSMGKVLKAAEVEKLLRDQGA